MAEQGDLNGTGIRTFPPLVFALALGAAFGANRLIPLNFVPDSFQIQLGLLFFVPSICLLVYAALQFHRHKTTIHVGHAARALMMSGPYRFSRNPIYLAMLGATLGIGLAADLGWIIPFLALAILYLQRNVIDLEEAFLEQKFGEDYRDYKSRVRRWL